MHHTTQRTLGAVLAAGLIGLAGAAHAHTGGVHGAGFEHGFAHPFGGVDHLLAMVTVGLWAAQRGGRALWAVPLSFMGMMLAGGLLGLNGVALPSVELGIAASLVVLGSLVALAVRPSAWLGAAIVGVFAVFHGHAHGAEAPEAAAPALYAAGFVAATGLLHLLGIAGFRSAAVAKLGGALVRLTGAAVAASGLALLAV